MMDELIGCGALGAERALIDRMIFVGFEPDELLILLLENEATADAAVGADGSDLYARLLSVVAKLLLERLAERLAPVVNGC